MYAIMETHGSRRRSVKKLVNTARYGWTTETKTWKTESSAKAWITRRMKQLKQSDNVDDWQYEIIKW